MRAAEFAVACLGAAGVAAEEGTRARTAIISPVCISVSPITETSAHRTLTTTVAIAPSTNLTRCNATSRKNGTRLRGAGRPEFSSEDSIRETCHPTALTAAASTDTVICATGSASSTCSCYTISRYTTTVTVDEVTITELESKTRLPPYPANGTLEADVGAFGGTQRHPLGQSSMARFLDTSMGSAAPSRSPVVYVVNSTTTLVTITRSASAGKSGTYTNSSSPTPTPLWTNSTKPFNTSATRLFDHSIATVPINSTRPWLNSSAPLPRITNRPWLNASTLQPLTNTRPRWLNTSLPRLNATTTGRWLNTTRSSTATPTSTMFPELGCDPSTVPFTLQISQPDGTFDNWFLRVSGIGLLFTSVQEQASPFGVGPSGELCAMGLEDGEGVPYVAIVERQESGAGGSVWLTGRGTLDVRGDDYTALRCERADQELTCRGGSEAQDWLGCGMQLDLASDGGAGPERGLNCTAVGLEVLVS